MNSYEKASNIFDTTFDVERYFESLSAEHTRTSLLKAIESKKTPLIFLLGEPGVGKTYMLNLLQKKHCLDKEIFFTSEPFSTPESFLHFLIPKVDKSLTISELKNEAITIFKERNNLIIIDEAQLLNNTILEFIRTLSDTNHFTFLLSMHKEEGEEIVKKQHFLSRNHRVITLSTLQTNEIIKYVEAQLLKHGLGEISDIFSPKHIKLIRKISHGNFRIIKQIVKHSFLIMEYAKTHGHSNYTLPNSCVITMAGIDLGIIDA